MLNGNRPVGRRKCRGQIELLGCEDKFEDGERADTGTELGGLFIQASEHAGGRMSDRYHLREGWNAMLAYCYVSAWAIFYSLLGQQQPAGRMSPTT